MDFADLDSQLQPQPQDATRRLLEPSDVASGTEESDPDAEPDTKDKDQ